MKVDKILPCVCSIPVNSIDNLYAGMPNLKVSPDQTYNIYCPKCGRGGCIKYKSPYLALKGWNRMQKNLYSINEGEVFE